MVPQTIIDTPAIELDPEFSRDGQSLFLHLGKGRAALRYGGVLLIDGTDAKVSEGDAGAPQFALARRWAARVPVG